MIATGGKFDRNPADSGTALDDGKDALLECMKEVEAGFRSFKASLAAMGMRVPDSAGAGLSSAVASATGEGTAAGAVDSAGAVGLDVPVATGAASDTAPAADGKPCPMGGADNYGLVDNPFATLFESFKQQSEQLFGQLSGGLENFANGGLEDILELADGLSGSFKSILDDFEGQAKSFLTGILDQIAPGLGGTVGGLGQLFGFAGGGRVQKGRPVIVGERGPELLVPGSTSTVVNNADFTSDIRSMMAMAASAPAHAASAAKAPPTQVVVHNHSGAETRTKQRRGPDGQDLIEVIVGRVADDMARGGRIADAASLRFGLNARGT